MCLSFDLPLWSQAVAVVPNTLIWRFNHLAKQFRLLKVKVPAEFRKGVNDLLGTRTMRFVWAVGSSRKASDTPV